MFHSIAHQLLQTRRLNLDNYQYIRSHNRWHNPRHTPIVCSTDTKESDAAPRFFTLPKESSDEQQYAKMDMDIDMDIDIQIDGDYQMEAEEVLNI